MIKDLTKGDKTNWGEKIQIELTLADLQMIYDCIGAVPPKYLRKKHEKTNFNKTSEYYFENIFHSVYEELEYIVKAHNGIIDTDENVNINMTLDITEE